MKRLLLIILFFCLTSVLSHARDYTIKVNTEYYREQPADSEHNKIIYHAFQVDSAFGSKLLILTGDNDKYRIWLREYLVNYKKFIVKIPDSEDNAFRIAKVFKINITHVHPIDADRWEENESGQGFMPVFKGIKHILIVDSNAKRRKLQEMIVKNLGYPVTVADNGVDALKMFKMQPDKFSLVITENMLPGMNGVQLVRHMIKEKPEMPVILGTGYNKGTSGTDFSKAFEGSNRVVVKSVILRELSKSILNLLGRKA